MRADRDAIAHRLATHPSDVARGWATQWIQFSDLPLPAKLQSVRRFAADLHLGVREMAWMAVRAHRCAEGATLARLQPQWVEEVCGRWSTGAPGPECDHIVRRACRTMRA